MSPKEKADELFDKMMYHIMYNCQPTLSEMVAKQCALIAVDEIIEEVVESADNEVKFMRVIYWEKVKQEINKQ
jgi:hypothetical protein